MVLTACGGGDGKVVLPDAATTVQVCDVLMGTGCAAGEKCTFIIEAATEFPSVCLPAGTKAEGEACSLADLSEAKDRSKLQDTECEKGTFCLRGVCSKICPEEARSCSDDGTSTCRVFGGPWADQPDSREIGFCQPQCDPLLQNECLNDLGDTPATDDDLVEGCFRKRYIANNTIVDVDFQCFGVDTAANTQTAAGAPCVGPQAGQCYINGVPRGTTLLFTGRNTPGVVTPYCRFQEAHLETNPDQAMRDDLANGIQTPTIEGGRPGNCSTDNFATGDGNNSSWECRSFDEMSVDFIRATAQASIGAEFTKINDKYDLPTGVGICVDTMIMGNLGGQQDEQIYPTVTAFDLKNVRDDIAEDGSFDGKIAGQDYELCGNCLTTEGWITFAGSLAANLGARVKQLIAMKAKNIQQVVYEAPIAPTSLKQDIRALIGR